MQRRVSWTCVFGSGFLTGLPSKRIRRLLIELLIRADFPTTSPLLISTCRSVRNCFSEGFGLDVGLTEAVVLVLSEGAREDLRGRDDGATPTPRYLSLVNQPAGSPSGRHPSWSGRKGSPHPPAEHSGCLQESGEQSAGASV